jgi:hypothetical protein
VPIERDVALQLQRLALLVADLAQQRASSESSAMI